MTPSDQLTLALVRGHDARLAGRAHQVRGLREGDPRPRSVRARGGHLPARRDAGGLRPPRGVEPGRVAGGARPSQARRRTDARGDVMSAVAVTAMPHGLQSCPSCSLLSRPAPGEEEGRCPRCDRTLSFREAGSIQRSWAFLIAAAICYIPANLLPVLTTVTASGRDSDPIMQGVVVLTMLAVESFDPRLIWDPLSAREVQHA